MDYLNVLKNITTDIEQLVADDLLISLCQKSIL